MMRARQHMCNSYPWPSQHFGNGSRSLPLEEGFLIPECLASMSAHITARVGYDGLNGCQIRGCTCVGIIANACQISFSVYGSLDRTPSVLGAATCKSPAAHINSNTSLSVGASEQEMAAKWYSSSSYLHAKFRGAEGCAIVVRLCVL